MRPSHHYFVTGTDTEIGKTLIACALLHLLAARGLSTVGMKPVAAGTQIVAGCAVNEDVEHLRAASTLKLDARAVNTYLLQEPIAPHIAAAQEGTTLDLGRIAEDFRSLQTQAEAVIVEGVGGFRVPLDDTHDTADLAQALGLPVILVVGMRLGCLNHALLSAEAICARGLKLAGWVANQCGPSMLRQEENVKALERRLDAPLLGVVPHLERPDPAQAAGHLRLP